MTHKQTAIAGTIAAAIVAGSIVTLKQPTEPLPPLPPGWTPSTIAQRVVIDGPPITNFVHLDLEHNVYLKQSYDGITWNEVPVVETFYGPYNHVIFTNFYTNQSFFRTYVK